jgi:cytochrome c
MRVIYTSRAIGAVFLVAAGSAFAQQAANPQRGHELAETLCTNCHAVDRKSSSPMQADVPSFPAIAKRTGTTAEHLAGKIIVPHPAMPGVPLTAAEIRDIVAYILTLKSNE